MVNLSMHLRLLIFEENLYFLNRGELRKKGWLLNKVERRGVELKGDSNLAIVYFFFNLVLVLI